MTLTIKGMDKHTYNNLLTRLDVFAGGNVDTIKEIIELNDGNTEIIFSVSIHNTDEYALKLSGLGLDISRIGVVPAFSLHNTDFDTIFIS